MTLPSRSSAIVTTDDAIMGGVPCFDGTRVPITAVTSFADEGYSVSQIMGEYPTLSRQQIVVGMEIAAALRARAAQENEDGLR